MRISSSALSLSGHARPAGVSEPRAAAAPRAGRDVPAERVVEGEWLKHRAAHGEWRDTPFDRVFSTRAMERENEGGGRVHARAIAAYQDFAAAAPPRRGASVDTYA